jgi:hypothetical protein
VVPPGSDNKWSVPANWKVGDDPENAQEATVKPGIFDDVVFDGSAGNQTWSTVDEEFEVRNLKITKEVGDAAADTLTLAANLTVGGEGLSEIAGGVIAGAGTLALGSSDYAELTWMAGIIKAEVTIPPEATLILKGDPNTHEGVKWLQGGKIVNEGTASWNGEGELKLDRKLGEDNGGAIINHGAFAFTGQVDKEITGWANTKIENKSTGTIDIAYAAGKQLWFVPSFDNYGFVNLNSGHAKTGFTQFGGPISIAAGPEFRMGYTPNINQLDVISIARGEHGPDLIVGEGKAIFGEGSIVKVWPGNGTVTFKNVDDYSYKLHGDGNFVVTGTYRWFGDPADNTGRWFGGGWAQIGTETNTGAVIWFYGDTHVLHRNFTNYGTANWISARALPQPPNPPAVNLTIDLGIAGVIENKGNAVFSIESSWGPTSQKITAVFAGLVTHRFVNGGTLNTKTDLTDPATGNPGGSIEIQNYLSFEDVHSNGSKFTGTHNHQKGKVTINDKETIQAGAVSIAPGAVLIVGGGVEQLDGDVNNEGIVEVVGGYQLVDGDVTTQSNGTDPVKFTADFVDQSGGTFTFTSNITHDFTVTDTYTFSGGTASISVPYTGTNMALIGHLEVEDELFQLGGRVSVPEDINVAAGGGLQLSQYADIFGDVSVAGTLDMVLGARINGNLTNSGLVHVGVHNVLNPGETVSINGNYTQTSTGTLRMDVGTGQADRLNVSGTATLAGTLEIKAAAGFMLYGPLTLMSYGSRVGTFDTLVSPPGVSMTMWYDNPFSNSMGIKPNW